MAESIRDVMTPSPRTVDTQSTVRDAARIMFEDDIGDVIACEQGKVRGILTDRDIVVRVVAQGKEPATVKVGDIMSSDLATVTPTDSVDRAIRLMREKAVRRLPVVDGDRPVGVVSIGDLAIDLDKESALADISKAPANT